MATTVGHALIGIAVYCGVQSCLPTERRKPLTYRAFLLVAVAANLPDLDMLISLVVYGDQRVLHGGMTHTFVFAVLVGLLVWAVRPDRKQIGVLAFLAVLSHVLVDWVTGPQPGLHASHGLALFWPVLHDRVQLPVTLFKGVNHAALFPGALITAFWELIIIGPPVAVSVVALARRGKLLQSRRIEGKGAWFSGFGGD